MELKLIYLTVPDERVAKIIAQAIVTERLAACVNILPAIKSHYIWENQYTQTEEILLLAKTAKEQELIARVKELHPFDTPCIVALDINGGNQDFLDWIAKV